MYSTKLRILFGLIGFALLIKGVLDKNMVSVGLALLFIMLIVSGYYRHGTVWLANRKIRNGQLDAAQKLLHEIKNPERLAKQSKAYYHFAIGSLALHNNDWGLADQSFDKAIDWGLRNDSDKAVALANLAISAIGQENITAARQYLDNAKNLDYPPAVANTIKEIETNYL